MPVLYDGNAIIPAPFVRIAKDYQKADDGSIVGSIFNISIQGKLICDKGSPNSSGQFWTASGYPPDETLTVNQFLKSLLAKQAALRAIFAVEGKTLEIVPLDGSTPFKFNPRVKDIQFPAGNWTIESEYEITLEADGDSPEDANHIAKASEEWAIEQTDDRQITFRLTHTVGAVGKRFYDSTGALTSPAWQRAKDYVLNKIGLGLDSSQMAADGVLNADSLRAYNYARAEQVNKLGGSFQVTETWLCFDPGSDAPAVEEFTVTTVKDETGRTKVGIEGNVQGLRQRDNSSYALITDRYTNANSKWTSAVLPNLFTRCQSYSGVTLNVKPLNTRVGRNQVAGTITYSYDFDDRPTPSTSGAISEVISVIDDGAVDLFAKIPVLGGGPFGTILQDIGTFTEKKRQILIEIQMPCATQSFTPTQPTTTSIVNSLLPVGNLQTFIDKDSVSWVERTGKYSRSVGVTWK
jgi:hypothetical protein